MPSYFTENNQARPSDDPQRSLQKINDILLNEQPSLRDYFAAHAMQSFITPESITEAFDAGDISNFTKIMAAASYEMADAMLAIRNQPETQQQLA